MQLAVRRLRTAKPRLGQPRRAMLAPRSWSWCRGGRRLPVCKPIRHRPQAIECDDWIFVSASGCFYGGARLLVELIHARVRMGPSILEACLIERT